MDYQKRVLCPENEELALYVRKKRQEMDNAKGISEHIDRTLYKAYSNVCNSKVPIKTLKEFSKIKGVGKWILRLVQGFFQTDSGTTSEPEPEPEDVTQKGKKTKGTRRYVPQKGSVAYALLITLYRAMANGNEFMRKQELIDAAETSGLARVPIVPEKERGKLSGFGSSPKEWYSGWCCMTTLITKGLVVKSSCPAKYMLTQEGREAARECLLRSGLIDELPSQDVHSASDLGSAHANSACKERSHPKEQTFASTDLAEAAQKKKKKRKTSSVGPAIVHQPKKDEICASNLEPKQGLGEDCFATLSTNIFTDSGAVDFVVREKNRTNFCYGDAECGPGSSCSADSARSSYNLKACSSSGYNLRKSNSDGSEAKLNALAMPPLGFGERFEEVYDVSLILDDREQFTNHGSRYRRIIENVRAQFKIQVEVRRLPVGDGIWIARHRFLKSEYVLDFVVERKGVDDLRCSIRDNRYRDQKLRLLRCGLKKLIYLVEGDPNSCEGAESIKTACFTTEILEGFDVQRTSGLSDTVKRYAHLTLAITDYYRTQFSEDEVRTTGKSLTYDEFVKKCGDLDKMTVSDVFALQLMQVGGIDAQEEMLRKQSNNLIGAVASRNIFQLVWGG
ncbi:crossover junction endonuclease MUS81 isoform X2 [Telopea speciosissima]|uniref:crossover junction endonuclease MUS81 isoform X2 n=1 Tax=Telopea speciosissima TaxID=54955 RepID=UPI001CC55343|nr:crossover junction endonuclease MUS81 isoform X2 [Telopea speciosissima]